MNQIIASIDETIEDMTLSQRKVALYIKEHSHDVPFDTLDCLAGKIGVSTTTVIRFARMLGYSGFGTFQQALQRTMKEYFELPTRFKNSIENTEENALLQKSFAMDIENIIATRDSLKQEALTKALDLMQYGKSIVVVGMRESFALAHYMYSRLTQIKDNVRLIHGIGAMYPEEMLHLGENDVCIFYLFPRYSSVSLQIMQSLKSRGVKIILITSENNERVCRYADVLLAAYVSSTSFKNTSAAPIALTNYLATATAAREYEKSMERLAQMEQELKDGAYILT